MIFTQPVIHELERLEMPVTFMIGQKDRTAPGANRASEALAKRLGDYPALGEAAADAAGQGELIAFPELGHAPMIEAPDRFLNALKQTLSVRP